LQSGESFARTLQIFRPVRQNSRAHGKVAVAFDAGEHQAAFSIPEQQATSGISTKAIESPVPNCRSPSTSTAQRSGAELRASGERGDKRSACARELQGNA